MEEAELKSLAERIVRAFLNAINVSGMRKKIDGYIRQKYHEGLEDAEVKFDMNFIPDKEKMDFLKDYVDNSMSFHTDALGRDLRGEISRALIDRQTPDELKRRIREVFKEKKYINRLKTVLRTEGLRAGNYGSLDGAKQSGLVLKKYVAVIVDGVTSDICKAENRKYGKEEQAIPLEQDFIVSVRGETFRAQAPPFHPNCRTVIMFTKVKGGKE